MVSGRQRAVCNWRRLGDDKKTWPTHNGGSHFTVMMSKWFRFEEAFVYAFMCENRRELGYKRLLVSVGGLCARVRFETDSASLGE